MLLRAATEEDFSRWVRSVAWRNNWHGLHIRWSQGVLQSVHSVRRDGWSEAYGLPDWFWWSPERGQHFWSELKSWEGRLSKEQVATISDLRDAGETVFVWRPQDEEEVERTFRNGIGGNESEGESDGHN